MMILFRDRKNEARPGEAQEAVGPLSRLEQNRLNSLAQAVELVCIMTEERVVPSPACSFATVLRHRQADCFVRAEFGSEVLWLIQGTENVDSLRQMPGNPRPHLAQPIQVAIEIDQQDDRPVRITFHSSDVV